MDEDDGQFWMCADDFHRNVKRVDVAISPGMAWKKVTQTGALDPEPLTVCVVGRSIPPPWGSIRCRLALRTYDAPPWGCIVYVW